jgi:hypothetical protein
MTGWRSFCFLSTGRDILCSMGAGGCKLRVPDDDLKTFHFWAYCSHPLHFISRLDPCSDWASLKQRRQRMCLQLDQHPPLGRKSVYDCISRSSEHPEH